MKRKTPKNRIAFAVILALIPILLVAIICLMTHVQHLLNSDTKINLTEVVTQNKDVITSRIQLEVHSLELVAKQLGERLKSGGTLDPAFILQASERAGENRASTQVFVSNDKGITRMSDGTLLDISGRAYFRLAMQGTQNISARVTSRHTGEDIFVISAPYYLDNQIVGTVQRAYTPEEMYNICALSLFSSQGSMYILNSEGYILISLQGDEYNPETENYVRNIYAQGNKEASRQLQDDLLANKPGFLETKSNEENFYAAYTPIDEVHDWYLISSVAVSAVSSNANTVIKMFYVILCILTLVFSIFMLYFYSFKNKQQGALERVAFVDSITKGNTFNKFLLDLESALHENPHRDYNILSFDIDHFRYVNNYYGFDFGDRVLSYLYAGVSEKLREGESLARISGDRFVAFLMDPSKERLAKLIPLTFTVDDVTLYLSAGLYHITDRTESLSLMVDKATTAAQSTKDLLHKEVTTYSERFDQTMIHNEQLKRQVEHGLSTREFVPFYQPKVDVNTGKLVGAEALARWKMPDGTMVSPGDFIPLCEKTGQITELDLCIFEQVLEFLAEMRKLGQFCIPISVNFSRLHLLNKDFIHSIIQRMEELDVPPSCIEIELTESVFFHNHDEISEFAKHLHAHGLLISMDDFGSGYSSLNMLKDIPIDILKIDRVFLTATQDMKRQRIIFSSIVQMAEQLRTSIVVEGVETIENVEMMRELGCSVAQGYYFARPMPEENFKKIYQEGKV